MSDGGPHRGAWLALVALGSFVFPIFVAVRLLGVPEDEGVEILDDAFRVLVLGWVLLPLAFVAARRPRVLVVLWLGLASVVVGYAVWVVRPMAPTGDAYDTTYEAELDGIQRDAAVVLGDRLWGMNEGHPDFCEDQFGRNRGAAVGNPRIHVEHLDREAFWAVARAMAAEDRVFTVRRVDGPVERTTFMYNSSDGTIDVRTPCLRTEQTSELPPTALAPLPGEPEHEQDEQRDHEQLDHGRSEGTDLGRSALM